MSDDWESRSHQTPVLTHIIAGSLAGLIEHIVILPLDNIKTHCQAIEDPKINRITKRIYNKGGLKNFFSGGSVLAFSQTPSHAIYFSVYEYLMRVFGLSRGQSGSHPSYLYAAVGAIASGFHDLISSPADAIKQRLQLLRSQHAQISSLKVIEDMYKFQGLKSFYRSFAVNYFTNVPFNALIVMFNEKLKNQIIGDHESATIKYFLCSGIAGLIATIPTNPFDVIKTKMNTQDWKHTDSKGRHVQNLNIGRVNDSSRGISVQRFVSGTFSGISLQSEVEIKYPTIRQTIVRIYQQHGIKGFFKGLKMRILMQTPSSSISWGSYEIIKKLLTDKKLH